MALRRKKERKKANISFWKAVCDLFFSALPREAVIRLQVRGKKVENHLGPFGEGSKGKQF